MNYKIFWTKYWKKCKAISDKNCNFNHVHLKSVNLQTLFSRYLLVCVQNIFKTKYMYELGHVLFVVTLFGLVYI